MVAPIVYGILGIAGLLSGVTIISHLIFPISVIGALITFFATYRLVGYVEAAQIFSRDWMNQTIRVGVALVMGLVAYRAFVWVLAAGSLLTVGTIIVIIVVGGPGTLLAILELAQDQV